MLKVLITGTGDMADRHVQGWRASVMAEIEAVCGGRSEERLRNFQKRHEITNGGRDYEKMISELRPDVVSVCVPVSMHEEITCFAAENGAHVFCEKPLALTVDENRRMIEICKKNNVLLGADFERRYWEDALFFRKLITNAEIGRPVLWKRMDMRSVRPKTFLHDKINGGGVVLDCCIHWFDMWRKFFNSEPVSVYARGACLGKDKLQLEAIKEKAVDTAQITVAFASGDTGELSTSWGLPAETPTVESDILVGPQGYCVSDAKRITGHINGNEIDTEIKIEDWAPIISQFARAVKGEIANPVPGEDALEASKVAIAAIESIETGKLVKL